MLEVWNGKRYEKFHVLTLEDVRYLLKKKVDATKIYRYDMALFSARNEDYLYLRAFSNNTGIHFSKKEIPWLRTLARRHFFRLIPAMDWALVHMVEKKERHK
jgi:hypothetical protein